MAVNFLINNVIFVIFFSAVGTTQVCDYSLKFSVCLQHLAFNESSACDRLRSDLMVVHYLDNGGVHVRSTQMLWNEEPMEHLDFQVRRTKGNQLGFTGTASGVEKDLRRGVGRILVGGEDRRLSPSCSSRVAREGRTEVSRRTCKRVSTADSVYFIEDYSSETKLNEEEGRVKNVEINEVFTRSANTHQIIGERARTSLVLSQISCVNGKDERDGAAEQQYVEHMNDPVASPAALGLKDVEDVLSRENVLDLIGQLTPALRSLSEAEIGKLLKKLRNSDKLQVFLESCGGVGSLAAYTAVLRAYPPSTKNTDNLEKFLIALSFATSPKAGILEDLHKVVQRYKKSANVVETAFYCLCKQSSRIEKTREGLEEVLNLVGGLSCSTSTCQRMVLRCIAALNTDAFSDQVLTWSKSAKEKKIRELAASTLARPATVPHAARSAVQEEAWRNLNKQSTSNEEFAKMLELVDLKYAKSSAVAELVKTKNRERKSYLVQKLASVRKKSAVDYSLLSHTTQGESVYIHNALNLDEAQGRFTFATTMSGGSLSRTFFSLDLLDTTHHHKDILSIQSYFGGFSGFMGAADPDDDADLNASLQISLLGLPLRTLVLFSSMSDLVDLYFSGAGQQKTTLLQGVIPLEGTEKEWETSLGLRIKLHSRLHLHIHSSGEGSISIFESSGSGSLHTSVEVAGESRVEVEVPGGTLVNTNFSLNTGVTADSKVQLGSKLNACVIMSSDSVNLNLDLQTKKWKTTKSLTFPGFTWNLNKKNNEVCSMFSRVQ